MIKKAGAEFIGTFAIVFFGCGAIVVSESGMLHPAGISIVFGLIVTCMIYTFGHISGAHFNPSVTLAFAVMRHFPKEQVLVYWLAQCLGALAGAYVLAVAVPATHSLGVTLPHVTIGQAFLWETLLTFFLMIVVMAVATDTRAVGIMAGAAIGAIVMLDAFVGGPLTGCSLNPARTLGPAIVAQQFEGLWIYLTAPTLGTLLAAFVYKWIKE